MRKPMFLRDINLNDYKVRVFKDDRVVLESQLEETVGPTLWVMSTDAFKRYFPRQTLVV